MNILDKIKNSLKVILDDINANYEVSAKEIEINRQNELSFNNDYYCEHLNKKWHCLLCGSLLSINFKDLSCTNEKCFHFNNSLKLNYLDDDSYSISYLKKEK